MSVHQNKKDAPLTVQAMKRTTETEELGRLFREKTITETFYYNSVLTIEKDYNQFLKTLIKEFSN